MTAGADVVTLVAFGVVGVVFVFGALGIAGRLLRGRRVSYAEKTSTYECGETPVGDARRRFNPRFYLLAVVFVIFDVEVAFLFPWGVVYREAGMVAFLDMLVFLAILLVGYVWFWRLGELRWVFPEREP